MLANQYKNIESEIKDCTFSFNTIGNCKIEDLGFTNNTNNFTQDSSCKKDKSRGSYDIIKDWEGCVTEIEGEDIFAKLYDSEDDGYSIYEFSIDDISEDDLPLLKKGALFFLYIGYYTNDKGTRIKSSHIKFRRIISENAEAFIDGGLDTMSTLDFSKIWK